MVLARYIRIVNTTGNSQNNQMGIIDVIVDGNLPDLLSPLSDVIINPSDASSQIPDPAAPNTMFQTTKHKYNINTFDFEQGETTQ